LKKKHQDAGHEELARHAILLSQWNEQKGTCPRSARSGSVGPCHICRWEEEKDMIWPWERSIVRRLYYNFIL
jgi:hypothetical protein